MTKGEYRVGMDFNPSSDARVRQIKHAVAALIDYIELIPLPAWSDEDKDSALVDAEGVHRVEVARLKSLAQTTLEEGAMWAVKAATKGKP